MPMTFPCRACGKVVRVSRKAQGRWGKCPHCAVEAIVPTLLDSRVEATEDSGERAPLTNTMADTVHAPAPASPAATTVPSFAAVVIDLERDQLALERARVEADRARLDLELAQAEARNRETDECEACAEPIKARAKVCKHCGHVVGDRVKRSPRPTGSTATYASTPPRTNPNAGLAAVITFLIGPAIGWTVAGGCGWGLVGMGAQLCASVLAAVIGGRNEGVVLLALVVAHAGLAFLATVIANDQPPDSVGRVPRFLRRRR